MKATPILLLIFCLLAPALPACQSAKGAASMAFNTAQGLLERYRLDLDAHGDWRWSSNGRYAYAEGSGRIAVVILDLETGAEVFRKQLPDAEARLSKGWELYWDRGNVRPALRAMDVQDVKERLKSAPPPIVTPAPEPMQPPAPPAG